MADQAVSVVSGGGRGIGRAAALALGAAGHPVCVNDTGVGVDGQKPDPTPAEAVAAEIRDAGGQALGSAVDARSSQGAGELLGAIRRWSGADATVFVHAAGTLRDAMLHRTTDDDWAEVLGSHLGVAVEVTRAMAPALRSGGVGRIVYVGGAAGLVGNIGQASYAVAKAALFGLTRSVALEMAGRDISVNYLAPFAFTRMTETIPPATDRLRRYLESAPAARPADIAPAIAWLCSDAAHGVTGQIFGARGAELSLWSQPRPATTVVRVEGWSERAVTQAMTELGPSFTPLESEFDLFGHPPVAVVGIGDPA